MTHSPTMRVMLVRWSKRSRSICHKYSSAACNAACIKHSVGEPGTHHLACLWLAVNTWPCVDTYMKRNARPYSIHAQQGSAATLLVRDLSRAATKSRRNLLA